MTFEVMKSAHICVIDGQFPWKSSNAVERPSREQREWIRNEPVSGNAIKRAMRFTIFLHKTSRIGIFVSRRAGTLELL